MHCLDELPETAGRDALLFTLLTAVRSGETRLAVWPEFDLKGENPVDSGSAYEDEEAPCRAAFVGSLGHSGTTLASSVRRRRARILDRRETAAHSAATNLSYTRLVPSSLPNLARCGETASASASRSADPGTSASVNGCRTAISLGRQF